MYEALKFTKIDTYDRAEVFRLGILLFLTCFAIGNQIQNYKMVEQGAKYNLVKNLAYSDGLTGLGNCTSYLEKISELKDTNVKRVGIVFLDINNLKIVNDNYVHDIGDDYIITAANIIKDSYGKYGDSFRIGGDEFCVFIQGLDVNSIYSEATEVFDKAISDINSSNKFNVDMQIAKGFTVYERGNDTTLDDKIQESDSLMYTNKAMLKTSQKIGWIL